MTKDNLSEAERHVMARLAEALGEPKPEEVVVFTRDEAEVLQEWAKFMMAWRTLGRWLPNAKTVILSAAAALVFLAGARGDFLDWLSKIVGAAK